MKKIKNDCGKIRKRSFVIAGINGDIGIEFAKRLKPQGKLYGISRKPNKIEDLVYDHIACDLLKSEDVKRIFTNLKGCADMTYIHLPGKFRFQDENHPIEDSNNDGIDDDIFNTNVETFRTVKPHLAEFLKRDADAHLKLIAIGSASDLYDIPYWHSFTHSKNELRKEFRGMYGNPSTYGRVGALFINVSTTDGKQLALERPHISKRFVLTPREILDQTLKHILDDSPECLEVSVLKPNPDFEKEGYLSNYGIKKRWYEEMYG